MRFLLSFIFAGIAVRLKPTVTALLQRPLQRFRAQTRAGDIANLKTPPLHIRPLTPAVRGVLIGCLLLTLGVLTLLAPPVESHDTFPVDQRDPAGVIDYPDDVRDEWEGKPLHTHGLPSPQPARIGHAEHPGVQHDIDINAFFGGNLTALHPKHFEIQWIRVYKNPAIMSLDELQEAGDATAGTSRFYRQKPPAFTEDVFTNYVVTPPGFEYRRARLFSSLNAEHQAIVTNSNLEAEKDKFFWVKIDPGGGPSDPMSGGLVDRTLADGTKDPNSGLVTATENTVVVPGDIVAIAVNVKLHYYKAAYDFVHPTTHVMTSTERAGPFIAGGLQPDANREEISPGVYKTVQVESLQASVPLGFKPGQRGPDKNVVWANTFGFTLWEEPDDVYRYIADTDLQSQLDKLAGGAIIAAMHLPVVGILNPNYPLENALTKDTIIYNEIDRSLTHTNLGHDGMDGYHTLVYQFTVQDTADHLGLNNHDEWLKRSDRDGNVNPFNMAYDGFPSNPSSQAQPAVDYAWATFDGSRPRVAHEARFGFWVPFGDTDVDDPGWSGRGANSLHQFLDPADFIKNAPYSLDYRSGNDPSDPDASATYGKELFDRNSDGLIDFILPVEKADTLPLRPPSHYMVRQTFYDNKAHYFPHRLPPTYDDMAKKAIYYPTIRKGYVAAMTEIVDVPSGTQTGPFTLTLRFREEYDDGAQVAPGYGADVFATLQKVLSAGLEDGTVPGASHLGVTADGWRQYQVTVVPALGFAGEWTFQVEKDAVVAGSGLGNLASNAVTVSVNTVLPSLEVGVPSVVAPEAAAYSSGDKFTFEVPFAETGLTYEGEDPPYLRIYLGKQQIDENARDAIWQQGEERSGSTIVPFVYVLQEADVSVLQALEPEDRDVLPDRSGLGIPEGTRVVAPEAGEAGLAFRGRERAPVDAGEAAPRLSDAALPLRDASGSEPGPVTLDVPVPSLPEPVIYLPPTEMESKAVASKVPRSPVVFNELGNGSDAANDWLELRNVSGSDVSLKDWELSVVADGKKEDTSLIVFPDVSVPANGLLLITNSASDKTPLAGGKDKGLSHASLVDAGLSLPDDGKFLLILRNAKEKLGLDEAFIDVAGGGGSDTDAFVRDETGDYDTYVWPLQVLESPGDATEDALSSGKVWQRAKADIIGYHQAAWAEAAFTGIGYDRKVTRSAATAGTPGYPNGAAKTAASTPKGAVTISEIMFDSDRGKLPQWIELYNKSKTEALNLDRWQLEIQNRNSEDLIGRPIVTLTLKEKVIQPNQTLLIVAGDARASSADVFPADRVYNLLELHEKNLRIKTPRDTFLSGEGFYLKLSDRNGTKIDEVGNIDDNRRTDDAPVWVWPTNRREGPRSSVVRRYDKGTSDARDGMLKSNWALSANFNRFKVESLHYGHADDIGTPGYRKGGALPVELSSFKVTRTDEGPVIVTWTTESEVDNAGFNLRRSLTRDSGFTLLNPVLIAGAGTTGERQTYTFTDTSAKPGVEYYYQIEEVSLGGRPETLRTRRLPGPVSPANRALTTFGEVKQRE